MMPDASVKIRRARVNDVPAIAAVDPLAATDDGRQGFIAERVAACRTPRIFTSTHRSNLPMQRFLEDLGYRYGGVVDDLDPGDPELFYSRWLGDERLAAEEAG